MADVAVKPEIKVDPASIASPSALANIEEFEDDVDLTIPDITSPHAPQAWLVKVPDYIWKAWNDVYQESADHEPIELGKMRVFHQKPEDQGPQSKQKIQIRLAPGAPGHQGLPLSYDLEVQSTGYSNTVVFSEKDLPGHSTGPGSRRKPAAMTALKPGGIPQKSDRYGKPGSYRTAIPKQTALAPMIHHVADAHPVQDDTYWRHFKKQYDAAIQPRATTEFRKGIDRTLHPGTAGNAMFNSFSLTSKPKSSHKKPPREKAVRMSQQDLLDRLYQCFRRYKYWSLRALKNELKQPETFIKETLENIAVLIRSGDFAMNYKLKDDYASLANVKPEEMKEETALIKSEDEISGMEAEDAEMDGDEDDEGDFEDVKMEG
jgi:transcription initiation factor TFIIF subunit beta